MEVKINLKYNILHFMNAHVNELVIIETRLLLIVSIKIIS